MRFNIFFLVMLTLSFNSCSPNTSSNKEAENLIGKKIQFPESLQLLKDDRLVSINDFKRKTRNKSIIVSIIDIGCSKCIYNELNKLDSLFRTIDLDSTKFNIAFILNINKSDSASFMIDLKYAITTNQYLLWDNNYTFEAVNDIITRDKSKRTFLIDHNNDIILVGNPLFDNYLTESYYRKLSF